MRRLKKLLLILSIVCILLLVGWVSIALYLQHTNWGYARPVSEPEQRLRDSLLASAESWLGCKESDGSHQPIIDLYNAHEPLAQGYRVQYDDNWCATFVSAAAIDCGLTDIIPTECGCQRQIDLWKQLGCWEENDNYMPLSGDYIYYAWDERFSFGDCTGWADHVGIVVGTSGPFIKVIEGNKDDMVTYRIILRGDWQIRGYGLPDYGEHCAENH